MAYGILKVDNITFTNSGADQATTISGIYRAITSGVTVTGTISGVTIQGTTVSGTTVTGTTANFVSGVFTTQVSGATVTGTQSSFTSGNFVTLSGVTATFTSGVIASGTAAAPSLSILSDPNTGIYSPGADQVALATAGAGRLFVDASGLIGIGTAVPTENIDVVATETGGNVAVFARNLATATNSNAAFGLCGNNNAVRASWLLDGLGTVYGAGSIFYTETNHPLMFGTNAIERLRIDSSGRVGIGTTSPGAALDVVGNIELGTKGASNNTVFFDITSDTTYTDYGFRIIRGGAANGNTQLINRGTGALELNCVDGGFLGFSTSNTERVRIDSSGNVGIGTTTAITGVKLNVNTGINCNGLNASGTGGFFNAANKFGVDNNAGNTRMYSSGPDASTRGSYDFRTTDSVGTLDTSRMVIDSSGSVGIGTTSPATLLDISVAGGMARIGGGSGNNLIQAYTGAVGIGMWAGGNPRFYSTGGMIFSTNATVGTSAPTGYVDAMTIDSSGNVGIGVTSPNTLLHVFGGDLKVQKSSTTTDISELTFSNQFRTGRILSSYTNPASIAETYIAFHTNRTGEPNDTVGEAMRIAGGNVGIGTSSPAEKLHVNGNIALDTEVLNTPKYIHFRANSTSAEYGGIKWHNFQWNNTIRASITSGNDGAIFNGYLAFSTGINGLDATEKMRIDGSGRLLVGTSSDSGGALLQVNGDRVRIATAKTPASASDTGVAGEICWDASYIYVCTATNTWKRTAISTW
jgi:hypothetical protein